MICYNNRRKTFVYDRVALVLISPNPEVIMPRRHEALFMFTLLSTALIISLPALANTITTSSWETAPAGGAGSGLLEQCPINETSDTAAGTQSSGTAAISPAARCPAVYTSPGWMRASSRLASASSL